MRDLDAFFRRFPDRAMSAQKIWSERDMFGPRIVDVARRWITTLPATPDESFTTATVDDEVLFILETAMKDAPGTESFVRLCRSASESGGYDRALLARELARRDAAADPQAWPRIAADWCESIRDRLNAESQIRSAMWSLSGIPEDLYRVFDAVIERLAAKFPEHRLASAVRDGLRHIALQRICSGRSHEAHVDRISTLSAEEILTRSGFHEIALFSLRRGRSAAELHPAVAEAVARGTSYETAAKHFRASVALAAADRCARSKCVHVVAEAIAKAADVGPGLVIGSLMPSTFEGNGYGSRQAPKLLAPIFRALLDHGGAADVNMPRRLYSLMEPNFQFIQVEHDAEWDRMTALQRHEKIWSRLAACLGEALLQIAHDAGVPGSRRHSALLALRELDMPSLQRHVVPLAKAADALVSKEAELLARHLKQRAKAAQRQASETAIQLALDRFHQETSDAGRSADSAVNNLHGSDGL